MQNRRAQLAAEYDLLVDGDGDDDALEGLGAAPVTLVNFFALRAVAEYPDGETCSGVDAMLRYSGTSDTRLAGVGGRFVAQALSSGTVWGDAADRGWDLVVVATYPNLEAFWSLLADDEYRAAFVHRRAAVARQRVDVGATL